MTVRSYRRDGSWFWNHLRFSPVVENSGTIRHLVVIADDITETVQNQRRIAESEARKSAILRSSLDCVLTVDVSGLILDCNPAAALALGYDCGDRINQELKDLIVPTNSDRLGASEVTVGERREISVIRGNGPTFPADLVVTAMLERGQPIYTAHLRDLTTWKKALKQQRETVMNHAALLHSEATIANALGIAVNTLRKHFTEELMTARAKKRAEVLVQLAKAARAGNVSAMKALYAMMDRAAQRAAAAGALEEKH